MPGEEADDAEVSPSPLAKKLRCDRSKTVRFSPAAKALGGGLSQRQGQPLATLQLTSLTGAFGHESPRHALCPVAESRESTPLQGPSVRPSTDDHATQMREGSTDEFAATANGAEITSRTDNPGTPELSTAMRLLPRTPHFDAIARAAAGSSLEGVAEPSPSSSTLLCVLTAGQEPPRTLALLSDQEGASRSWTQCHGAADGPPVQHPEGLRCCAARCTTPGGADLCNIWKEATSSAPGPICRRCSVRFDKVRAAAKTAAKAKLHPVPATTPRTSQPKRQNARARSEDSGQPNEEVEDDKEDEAEAEDKGENKDTAALQSKLRRALLKLEAMQVQAFEERKQADADRRAAEGERVRLQQALDRTTASLGGTVGQLQTVQALLDNTVHVLNLLLRATHFKG